MSLPYPLSMEVSCPLNDVPALTLSSSAHAVNADLLAGPVEVVVEWSEDGQSWVEGPDARFLRIKRRGDGTDRAGLERYELPGYV
ncbi:hypothetical protein HD597_004398 [Nonomuraea thailandensis]|uniref:Uncharacterized protein n=1 Tax=Nonomuraea thailandensis TaxID=1188745 RepID=A0A9X2GMK3_9ACTN|nr:hypothetical protein [Nonomuraea thailandensis]MCP2357378.1 hypothetical protein [Nonomuraea thailandensis]